MQDLGITSIFLIALALAVDAFAVALAAGVTLPKVSFRHTFRLAWHFGFFQGGMSVIGWAGGLTFRTLIESYDHWLAFVLLFLVAVRMIHEALVVNDEEKPKVDPTRGFSMVLLSVAVSVDALAIGLSFAFLQISIWLPAVIIGIVASVLTAIGLHLGRMLRRASRLGTFAELSGAVVLIGIGVKILFDHGVF
jgi:putative Mn2+ efflux pump MntP